MIFDFHCDTVHKIDGAGELLNNSAAHLDLCRMKAAGYKLQTFAAFVDIGRSGEGGAWGEALSLLQRLKSAIEENDALISVVQSRGELSDNLERGKMSALLSVEEGDVIEGNVSRVEILAGFGVRMTTFTWNYDNGISGCAASGSDKGLTPMGYDFLSEIERRGIIADVSHISDRGFYDIAAAAKRPFLASHSNSRAVCGVRRNLTDDMIKIIAERGGVVGLNYYADFIGGDGSIEALMHHAVHIKNVGGAEVLALGSDFDGIEDNPYIKDASAVVRIGETLLSSGFSNDEADLVLFGNAKRFLYDAL